MKATALAIPEIILFEPKVFGDERGFFFESFNKNNFNITTGISPTFVQDNHSKSTQGVLRGLHYQLPPFDQSKLIRAINGSILDVVVDIRQSSPTFGKHVAVELTSENKCQLFVPSGFAHGFVVLSDKAIITYKVDNYYSKKLDRGIAFNDEDLSIDWIYPLSEIKISNKDKLHPKLSDAIDLFK